MLAGIRTSDLSKIYTSPPPLASGGGFGFGSARGKKNKQPKAEIVALEGLSLEITPGEIFGLLGPNGAGKSTTVGILTTRVRPTGGQAWIGEHDVWREQVPVKRLIEWCSSVQTLTFLSPRAKFCYFTAPISVLIHGNDRNVRTRCSIASNSPTGPIRWCADFPAA